MNDVPRSFRGNSNAARDIAHHLHPYTNFKKHEQTGPLTIVRGRGVYVVDDDGKDYIEGMAGLWGGGDGRPQEEEAAAVLSRLQPAQPRARDQPRGEDQVDGAVRGVEGVLRQLR